MPSRLIRDDMIDSERYWSVSIEARELFVHLLLRADEFGLFDAGPSFVRRTCFGDKLPPVTRVQAWLTELVGVDLIRLYEHDHRSFGFVPNYGQRLRVNPKLPMPPSDLYADDEKALALFNENKEKFAKKSAERARPAVTAPPDVEVEVQRREEEVEGTPRPKAEERGRGAGEGAPGKTGSQTGMQTPTPKSALQGSERSLLLWATAHGITKQPNESEAEFNRRASVEYSRSLTSSRTPTAGQLLAAQQ